MLFVFGAYTRRKNNTQRGNLYGFPRFLYRLVRKANAGKSMKLKGTAERILPGYLENRMRGKD